MFITFEGMDGSGKSTQVALLEKWLVEKGQATLVLRDPGSTLIGEKIRDILLDKSSNAMNSVTELLLYAASRSQLVKENIEPALKEHKIVICDRFYDSTTAYQGFGRKLSPDLIHTLNHIGSHTLNPDLSLFLDLDIESGLKRLDKTRNRDRMEEEDFAFKKRVRKGFLEISENEKSRFITVDASLSEKQVHTQIIKHVKSRLKL